MKKATEALMDQQLPDAPVAKVTVGDTALEMIHAGNALADAAVNLRNQSMHGDRINHELCKVLRQRSIALLQEAASKLKE